MQPSMWKRFRNILSYPYGWQHPAKTEEWANECSIKFFPNSTFIQLVCFPWATLIDLQIKKKNDMANKYIKALATAPPKTTLIRATFCQHINALDMLFFFKQLKITDLFWSHATKSKKTIDGIRIHPFPLYPVCCSNTEINNFSRHNQRKLLYSFIGAYQPKLYISKARKWIYDLPKQPDAIIEQNSEWFFNGPVYYAQIEGHSKYIDEMNKLTDSILRYKKILENSIFSLCPSGSGPNSIRLWESLQLGCIPVIISDDLRLPGECLDWDNSIVFIKEDQKSIHQIPYKLKNIANNIDLLKKMQNNCKKLLDVFDFNLLTKSLFTSVLPSYLHRTKQLSAQV